MRAIGRIILILLVVIGGFIFVRRWHSTTPFAVGTGSIGGNESGTPFNIASGNGASGNSATKPAASEIDQIAADPSKFVGKTVSLSGRVHGATKYASNRNMYTLADENGSVLVIDDKPDSPEIDRPRDVTGVVKTIGPSIGGLAKPYVLSVKEGAKIEEPKWTDVAHFFTDKVNDLKTGAKEATHGG